ncbi:hypothetical protein PviCFBP13515_16570 [Pseudomonas viridiflava]|uniref:Uncharacterized protein n=1 Tax=Pseudomonas viridiflava TaxID=33069 RepID=A0AA46ZZV2_PSEVI|nr:hypothetical protein PviCFBP13507_08290 [Pseudomonas viridiflava]TKK25576.1 hypothetical protein PviCFBP13515_16570 [Pseudomonas viridiflava]UZA71908.1 hypothetical protein EZZ81_19235 [Pseudomonas viridiflava]
MGRGVATTFPACCGDLGHPFSKSFVRRRNRPSVADEMKRLEQAFCYTVRWLCVSTLHVSLIIRVLPRAESAAGWHLPRSSIGKVAHHGFRRCSRSIRS